MENAQTSSNSQGESSHSASSLDEDSGPENSCFETTDDVHVDPIGQYQSYAGFPMGSAFPGNRLYSLLEGLSRLPSWSVNPQDLVICLRAACHVSQDAR